MFKFPPSARRFSLNFDGTWIVSENNAKMDISRKFFSRRVFFCHSLSIITPLCKTC